MLVGQGRGHGMVCARDTLRDCRTEVPLIWETFLCLACVVMPKVGFRAQRGFYRARGSLAGSWDAKGWIPGTARVLSRRGSLAGSWDAKGRVPGTARVLSRKRFQDGAGRLGWFWRSGLDRARWIAGSGLVLAEWNGSGRMDWLGAR